jgi:hypothetical protein
MPERFLQQLGHIIRLLEYASSKIQDTCQLGWGGRCEPDGRSQIHLPKRGKEFTPYLHEGINSSVEDCHFVFSKIAVLCETECQHNSV